MSNSTQQSQIYFADLEGLKDIRQCACFKRDAAGLSQPRWKDGDTETNRLARKDVSSRYPVAARAAPEGTTA